MTTTDTLATVTPLHRGPGWLPYRYSSPTDRASRHNLTRRMALVEDQLAVAYAAAEGDPVRAHALLTAAGCRVDVDQVVMLFDLSETAAACEVEGHWVEGSRGEYGRYLGHVIDEQLRAERAARSSVTAPACEVSS